MAARADGCNGLAGRFVVSPLLPGRSALNPISTRQLHRAVHEAAEAAGIHKLVSPHTLRHSLATHLPESDVALRVVQALPGHSKLAATALDTKVSTRTIHPVSSPLDRNPKTP